MDAGAAPTSRVLWEPAVGERLYRVLRGRRTLDGLILREAG